MASGTLRHLRLLSGRTIASLRRCDRRYLILQTGLPFLMTLSLLLAGLFTADSLSDDMGVGNAQANLFGKFAYNNRNRRSPFFVAYTPMTQWTDAVVKIMESQIQACLQSTATFQFKGYNSEEAILETYSASTTARPTVTNKSQTKNPRPSIQAIIVFRALQKASMMNNYSTTLKGDTYPANGVEVIIRPTAWREDDQPWYTGQEHPQFSLTCDTSTLSSYTIKGVNVLLQLVTEGIVKKSNTTAPGISVTTSKLPCLDLKALRLWMPVVIGVAFLPGAAALAYHFKFQRRSDEAVILRLHGVRTFTRAIRYMLAPLLHTLFISCLLQIVFFGEHLIAILPRRTHRPITIFVLYGLATDSFVFLVSTLPGIPLRTVQRWVIALTLSQAIPTSYAAFSRSYVQRTVIASLLHCAALDLGVDILLRSNMNEHGNHLDLSDELNMTAVYVILLLQTLGHCLLASIILVLGAVYKDWQASAGPTEGLEMCQNSPPCRLDTFPCLHLKDLSVVGSGRRQDESIHQMSFDIQPGETVAVLGPPGAGKTTLARIVTGQICSYAGHVSIDGESPLRYQMHHPTGVGLCPQHNCLVDRLTVWETLVFYCRLNNWHDTEHRVSTLMSAFRLENVAAIRCGILSPVSARWLQLAIAYSADPLLAVLDEPTAYMDESSSELTTEIIHGMQGTTLVCTPSARLALRLADRVVVVAQGTIVFVGAPEQLEENFGVGYLLTISMRPSCYIESLTNYIRLFVPRLLVLSTSPTMLTCILPGSATSKFEFFLANLDWKRHRLRIYNFEIQHVSMDDLLSWLPEVRSLRARLRQVSMCREAMDEFSLGHLLSSTTKDEPVLIYSALPSSRSSRSLGDVQVLRKELNMLHLNNSNSTPSGLSFVSKAGAQQVIAESCRMHTFDCYFQGTREIVSSVNVVKDLCAEAQDITFYADTIDNFCDEPQCVVCYVEARDCCICQKTQDAACSGDETNCFCKEIQNQADMRTVKIYKLVEFSSLWTHNLEDGEIKTFCAMDNSNAAYHGTHGSKREFRKGLFFQTALETELIVYSEKRVSKPYHVANNIQIMALKQLAIVEEKYLIDKSLKSRFPFSLCVCGFLAWVSHLVYLKLFASHLYVQFCSLSVDISTSVLSSIVSLLQQGSSVVLLVETAALVATIPLPYEKRKQVKPRQSICFYTSIIQDISSLPNCFASLTLLTSQQLLPNCRPDNNVKLCNSSPLRGKIELSFSQWTAYKICFKYEHKPTVRLAVHAHGTFLNKMSRIRWPMTTETLFGYKSYRKWIHVNRMVRLIHKLQHEHQHTHTASRERLVALTTARKSRLLFYQQARESSFHRPSPCRLCLCQFQAPLLFQDRNQSANSEFSFTLAEPDITEDNGPSRSAPWIVLEKFVSGIKSLTRPGDTQTFIPRMSYGSSVKSNGSDARPSLLQRESWPSTLAEQAVGNIEAFLEPPELGVPGLVYDRTRVELLSEPTLAINQLIWQRLVALQGKMLIYTIRLRTWTALQLFVPLALIGLCSIVIRDMASQDEAKLQLKPCKSPSFDGFVEMSTYSTGSSPDQQPTLATISCQNRELHITERKRRETRNPVGAPLQHMQQKTARGGCKNEIKYDVFYERTSYHSEALGVALTMKSYYQCYRSTGMHYNNQDTQQCHNIEPGTQVPFELTVHPLIRKPGLANSTDNQRLMTRTVVRKCIAEAVSLMVALCWLTATFAVSMVQERVSDFLHLQRLCGAFPLLHLISILVPYFGLFTVSTALALLPLAWNGSHIFKDPSTITLSLLLFAVAGLPLVRTLHVLFEHPLTAVVTLWFTMSLLGTVPFLPIPGLEASTLTLRHGQVLPSSWTQYFITRLPVPSASLAATFYSICLQGHKCSGPCSGKFPSWVTMHVRILLLHAAIWHMLWMLCQLDIKSYYRSIRMLACTNWQRGGRGKKKRAGAHHKKNRSRTPSWTEVTSSTVSEVILESKPPTIVLEHVSKRPKDDLHRGLRDVSFRVDSGCCLGILGLPGADMSTLLDIVVGRQLPDAGSVVVRSGFGMSEAAINMTDTTRYGLGYCPSTSGLMMTLTARETMMLFGRLRGANFVDLLHDISVLFEIFGLANKTDKLCGTYSETEVHKIRLCAAVIGNPRILVLDQPELGLTHLEIRALGQLLALHRMGGGTAILATALPEICEAVCTEVLTLRSGQLTKVKTVSQSPGPTTGGSRFCHGYLVKLLFKKTSNDLYSPQNDFLTEVTEKIPNVEIFTDEHGSATCHFLGEDVNLAKVFAVMEDGMLYYGLSYYTVGRAGLDYVFQNAFAPQESVNIMQSAGIKNRNVRGLEQRSDSSGFSVSTSLT